MRGKNLRSPPYEGLPPLKWLPPLTKSGISGPPPPKGHFWNFGTPPISRGGRHYAYMTKSITPDPPYDH